MGDIIKATEILKNTDIWYCLLVMSIFILLIEQLFKMAYNIFMVFYNKKHGLEEKDQNINDSIADLKESLEKLKELHEHDIKILRDEEKDDIKQIKESIAKMDLSIKEQNDKMEKLSKRDQFTNQAILRSDIIRIFKETKALKWVATPSDKENMEHLFESYFENGGNGVIKDIKKEYEKNVYVDYSQL